MKIGIMQPYFFPYIGYFALISAVDVFVFYIDVQYIRRGWINRNRILNRDKPELWEYINIPVKKTSRESKIQEIEIFDEEKWDEKLKKKLTLRYSKAPYFRYVKDLLFDIIERGNRDKLFELNICSVRQVCDYLDIHTNFTNSSTLEYNRELDAQGKLIDITKALNGSTYINPIGGRELYSKEEFLKFGLNIVFLKMNELVYHQGKGDFFPNLSIIDVLMWNSKEDIKSMLNNYTLVE
ncbi:hypothetical protein ES703_61550 [subsurface metagenome]